MWSIHDNSLCALADHPAIQRLFNVLSSIFGPDREDLPPSLQQTQPFLLTRDFGVAPWKSSKDKLHEIYRFQLGPRAWSKRIYDYDGQEVDAKLPPYQRQAEELATQLKNAGWEKVVQPLLQAAGIQDTRVDGEYTARLTLCWQADGRYCVLSSRHSQKAIAFWWLEDGLELLGEAHPSRLYVATNEAEQQPVLSLDQGTYSIKAADRAGQMDEFLAAVRWRYDTRLDTRLDEMLLGACDRLHNIEGDLGLAFADHRFNDAVGDDAWKAIRFGDFAWENGAYFHQNAAALRSAPAEAHALLDLLVQLQSSGLSSAFNWCYGYPVGSVDVLGIFRQAGKYYFACVNSHGSCGPAYEIDPDQGHTSLCGFALRFDWNFNTSVIAGFAVPKKEVMEFVDLNELVRRVKTGDTDLNAGPPHDLDIPWFAYLPRDPYR